MSCKAAVVRVRFRETVTSVDYFYARGQVCDLPADEAKRLGSIVELVPVVDNAESKKPKK